MIKLQQWGTRLLILLVSHLFHDASASDAAMSQRFDQIKKDPQQLRAFLTQMPKGGDLHSHLSGSVYAENIIHFAAAKGYCLNLKTDQVSPGQPCRGGIPISELQPSNPHYQELLRAWSIWEANGPQPNNHDHFFAIFPKIGMVTRQHRGDFLADVQSHAAADHLQYLELMLMPDNGESAELVKSYPANLNLKKFQKRFMTPALPALVRRASERLDDMENQVRSLLHCGTPAALPGCQVKVRYLAEVYRDQNRNQVLAQLITSFELSQRDSRIVGINFVGPEDGRLALKDYVWQMKTLHTLHRQYPQVHIALHAGELRPQSMKSILWRDHIATALHIGGAERIGHGTAILKESNATALMQEMTHREIPVEINLTSNAKVLSISGRQHPAPSYMKHQVPIILNTDDAGIFRTRLSEEYFTAVQLYHWNYSQIKQINRNSLSYSFLPGQSLWAHPRSEEVVAVCRPAMVSHQLNSGCTAFLLKNPKAQAQWDLEEKLRRFEAKVLAANQ